MSIDILREFKNSARDFRSEKLLLAVSGGLDSMVLWHLAEKAGLSYAIAHVNFQLRGDASMADEALVRKQATASGIVLELKRVDVAEHQRQHGGSTQMAARTLRYEWFEQLCREKGYEWVFTAHHQDDQIETFFLNLSRGTSLRGLKGMEQQNGKVVRPLLKMPKSALHAYAEREGVVWREDESNHTHTYKRNFIRLEILPLFQKLNPNFNQVQQENMELLTAANARVEKAFELLRSTLLKDQGDSFWVAHSDLLAHQADAYFFYELLRPFQLNYREAKDLGSAFYGGGTSVIHSKAFSFWLERDRLVIQKSKQEALLVQKIEASDLQFNCQGQTYHITRKSNKDDILTDARHASFDAGRLAFPLVLRPWQKGDRLVPLGMKGTKKVSDLLIDEKVDSHQKNHVYVLVSGGDIVWVVGYRISEHFKVTAKTEEVWQAVCETI